MSATWKAFERAVAKDLGTRRIPVTGIDRAGADVSHGPFSYQCKLGRRFPSYLREWLDGIRSSAKATNQIGVVVWREKGARTADALVCLRWADWVDLHGEPKDADVAAEDVA
jgi:hypothetical protein